MQPRERSSRGCTWQTENFLLEFFFPPRRRSPQRSRRSTKAKLKSLASADQRDRLGKKSCVNVADSIRVSYDTSQAKWTLFFMWKATTGLDFNSQTGLLVLRIWSWDDTRVLYTSSMTKFISFRLGSFIVRKFNAVKSIPNRYLINGKGLAKCLQQPVFPGGHPSKYQLRQDCRAYPISKRDTKYKNVGIKNVKRFAILHLILAQGPC